MSKTNIFVHYGPKAMLTRQLAALTRARIFFDTRSQDPKSGDDKKVSAIEQVRKKMFDDLSPEHAAMVRFQVLEQVTVRSKLADADFVPLAILAAEVRNLAYPQILSECANLI